MTDRGMTILSGKCMRRMAARKSLTDVDAIRNVPIITPGANLVIIEHTASSKNAGSPESL